MWLAATSSKPSIKRFGSRSVLFWCVKPCILCEYVSIHNIFPCKGDAMSWDIFRMQTHSRAWSILFLFIFFLFYKCSLVWSLQAWNRFRIHTRTFHLTAYPIKCLKPVFVMRQMISHRKQTLIWLRYLPAGAACGVRSAQWMWFAC